MVRSVLDETAAGAPDERLLAWEELNAEQLGRARSVFEEVNSLAQDDMASLSVAVRLLRSIGVTATVFHMNEGHAAFLGLERVRELIDFSVYLDISDEVKIAWKIQRDMAEPEPAQKRRHRNGGDEQRATEVGRDHDWLAPRTIDPGAGHESNEKARQELGDPQHADCGR